MNLWRPVTNIAYVNTIFWIYGNVPRKQELSFFNSHCSPICYELAVRIKFLYAWLTTYFIPTRLTCYMELVFHFLMQMHRGINLILILYKITDNNSRKTN